MSAQGSEGLLYDGKQYAMHTLPLEEHFKRLGHRPTFSFLSTNNWRGYVGEWEVVDGKLYLCDLLEMGLKKTDMGVLPSLVPNRIGIADIFPACDGSVFASWYTGQLRCPQGEVVEYYRGEFGALYERYLVIDVERGYIVASEEVPGIRNIDPRAFADVKCKACGFNDRLMLPDAQWYEPKQRNLPVWCKDCGTLTLSDYNKGPLRCGKCASKQVMNGKHARRLAPSGIFFGSILERIKMGNFRRMPADGEIQFLSGTYPCPNCGLHVLLFKRVYT